MGIGFSGPPAGSWLVESPTSTRTVAKSSLRLTFYATLLSPPYGVTTIRVRCERATSQIEDCRSASMEGTKKVSPAAFRW